MDVKMPDGTIIRDVPEGTTKAELSRRLNLAQAGPPAMSALQTLDDVARSIAQGVTFGFADEIAARVNPAINRALGLEAPETTEEALAQERARDAAIPSAIAIPGQIAGAVGSTLLAAPAVAAGAARAGLTSLPKAVQFGAVGASEGAVAGAGTATEGERLEGAALGAPLGAAVGATAPTVISGVTGLINRVRGAVQPQFQAAADVSKALRRDETPLNVIESRLGNVQQDRPGTASIADVGGENIRGIVERVAQAPGGGRAQIVPRLQGRQAQQAGRLASDLRSLTGTTRTAREAIIETMANRRQTANPIYRGAFRQFNEDLGSPALEALTEAPLVGEAMRRARRTGQNRAIAEGLDDFDPNTQNLQFWDQVKQELDDVGRQVAGPVGQQRATRRAQDAQRLARRLRSELDTLTGGQQSPYSQARNLWSGDAAYLDAIEQGRNIFRRNVSAEELAANFAQLSNAEQQAFREGAVSSIVARMGNDASKMGDMTKFLRSPEMRAKIATVMPSRELADAWTRRLDFEVNASELTGQALGNSATARRLAQRQDQEDLATDLIVDALSGAGSATLLSRVFTAGPRWMRDNLRARTDAELGDLLTNPNRAGELRGILTARQSAEDALRSGISEATLTAASVPAIFDLGGS